MVIKTITSFPSWAGAYAEDRGEGVNRYACEPSDRAKHASQEELPPSGPHDGVREGTFRPRRLRTEQRQQGDNTLLGGGELVFRRSIVVHAGSSHS
jgi:hypothetical protein